MTAAQYLTAWRRRNGLSDAAAAEWCCLSVSAFRRQRRGVVRDDRCRQTVRLAELYAIYYIGWLDVAETAMKVGRLLGRQTRRQPCRQTVRLAELYAIYYIGWLDVAETAMKVGRLLGRQTRRQPPVASLSG